MRIWYKNLAWLAAAVAAMLPSIGHSQDYTQPDPQVPIPLWHDRPETGGFYAAFEFLFMRQTNPIKNELIARRGLLDFDGSITADLSGNPIITPLGPLVVSTPTPRPGTFIGSGTPALTTQDIKGPQTWEPGWEVHLGWKFENGIAVDFSWMSLLETRYTAVATLVPPNLQAGEILQETFLFSPVFNFNHDFAGPPDKLGIGNPFAAFGIWNGATNEQISLLQRFDKFDIIGRIPLYETDCSRCYGLIGPSFVWFWERFKWITYAFDVNGQLPDGARDIADYTNIVSNRLYGVKIGGGDEFRLGDTPIGTFSVSLDLAASAYMDFIKERAKYTLGDQSIQNKRSRSEYKFVPEIEGQLNVWWYPIEGVQIRLGYDAMGFFNTVSAPYPVDFNYGRLDGGWVDGTSRWLDGFNFGIGFIF
jgi:hypothetical protein